MAETPARRRGRRARERDEEILAAARALLVVHPDAPMAEIGAAAGVGMSALYSRFGSREALVRRLADDANGWFAKVLDNASTALQGGADARDVLATFLAANVESDLWAVTPALDRNEREQYEIDESNRLARATAAFVTSLNAAGALREGITWLDLAKLLQGIGAIQADGPERTRALQRRAVQIVIDGLAPELPALAGPNAEPRDFQYRQRPRRARPSSGPT